MSKNDWDQSAVVTDADDERVIHLQRPRDLIRWAVTQFEQAELVYGQGTETALDEAAFMIAALLQLPQPLPDGLMDAVLLPQERVQILEVLDRRIQERIPAAHLVGQAWFCGLRFHVTEDVIVPRSPFAELIASGFVPWVSESPDAILDLCAGSGCIGIAAALHFPNAVVDLIELDTAAADVAQRNIESYGLDDQVRLLQQDLYDSDETGRYDLILSNPPYVPEAEWAALPAEYKAEPKLALASGEDGMDLPRKIIEQSADFLTEHGQLILEVGAYVAEFEAAFPGLPVTWLDLEQGGDGLCVIERDALVAYSQNQPSAAL